MSRHIEKRRQSWYAVLNIPSDVQAALGRKRFRTSLKTRDERVALRRAMRFIALWKNLIAKARNEPEVDDDQNSDLDEDIVAKAEKLRKALLNASTDKEREIVLDQIEMAAWDIGALDVDHVGEPATSSIEASNFHKRATGQVVMFTEHLQEWLSTSRATPKTKDMHKSDIIRFSQRFEMVQDVTRPGVRRWITEMMNEVGLKPKTLKRILSGIRSYWRYLQSIGVVDENSEPFMKLEIARSAKNGNPRSARLPFEPKEVLKLLSAAEDRNDQHLADLIRLGMWTGCRVEEICALKVEDVHKDHFTVKNAKTDAGWREVPIHPTLHPRLLELLNVSEDGFVLSGLSVNKYGDRSNAVSKRFGHLKSKLGFGPQHVFHSIRKTVVTILENAGVPENVVADIVGHEKTTMTYGLYSGGTTIATKRKAFEHLGY